MSIKGLITSFLLVSVALACANAGDFGENMSRPQLEEAFKRLAKYLNNHEQLDDAGLVKMAKSATNKVPFGDRHLRSAANILVYLYELETCTPKALDCMWYVLLGRPNAEPGWRVRDKHTNMQTKKDRLDLLLETSFSRAADKCKSFFNSWHDQSERAIEPASKQRLYNLLPGEDIAQSRREQREMFTDILVKAARKDAGIRKQVAQSGYAQMKVMRRFLDENYVKPCKKYAKAMEAVMTRANNVGLIHSRRASLFDKPSEAFLNSQFRFLACTIPNVISALHLDELAQDMARYY